MLRVIQKQGHWVWLVWFESESCRTAFSHVGVTASTAEKKKLFVKYIR